MAGFISTIKGNPQLLSFGFVLTFFSSFGQTFLLSLYVPEIAAMLGITTGSMGSVYATATLGSAAILGWAGRYIDYIDLKRYSLYIIAGCLLALLLLAQAHSMLWVILGILGLRLSGQGLLSHTAITTMARYFDKDRGKALSLASLGFPAGEAVLPFIIALIMAAWGWRMALLVSAMAMLLILPITVQLLLRRQNTSPPLRKRSRQEKKADPGVSSGQFLRQRNFWIIAPNVFLLGFLNTALFFYQVPLGAAKGWSKEWVAGSLAAFALASALSMFTAGPLVDRFSARRLFPWYLLPYLVGLLLLASFRSPWIYPFTLFLLGFANGLGSTIKNALQAELFGLRYLGSVRSLFTVLMVISTALGPLLFGQLLNAGLSFSLILIISAGAVLVTVIQSFRVSSARVLSELD